MSQLEEEGPWLDRVDRSRVYRSSSCHLKVCDAACAQDSGNPRFRSGRVLRNQTAETCGFL